MRTNSDVPGVYSEGDDGSGDSGVMPSSGPSRDAVKKLDQIIQVRIGSFHLISIVVIEANTFWYRTSIQRQLLLCYNRGCLSQSYTPEKERKRSINGYIYPLWL